MNTTINPLFDLGFGALFILFYAAGRFNTPATNRSSTTAGRYFLALFCYCMIGLIVYGALVQFPHLLAFVIQGKEDAVSPAVQKLSNPLMVALILTVLLPKLPLLCEPDDWIRKRLQDMAAIPYEVRRLSAALRKGKLEVAEDTRATVRQKLENAGFNSNNISFEPGRTAMHLWTRLAVLLANLEDWESDKKMSRYLAAFPGEVDQLRKRYDQLIPKAKTYFRLLSESAADSVTTKTLEALVRYKEDFMEQLVQLQNELLEFISRGVLHSELTGSGRVRRLEALGFRIELARVGFTFNHMMMLFSLVFMAMLAGSVFFSSRTGTTFGMMLARLVMVAVIYCVAIAYAIFPKDKWKFAKYQEGKMRPVGFYFVSALMAVVVSQCISLLFNAFLMRGFEGGLQRSLLSYPWLLTTFATTVMTGVLIDNGRFEKFSRLGQRVLEGLAQGIVMVGVSQLVHQWLQQRLQQVVQEGGFVPPNYRIPDAQYMMIMAGIIGFVIGTCIPAWYREAPRSRPEIRELDPEAALPAPIAATSVSSV